MIWLAYNALFALVYFLLLPKFLLRMRRRGGYGKGFLQRFAVYGPEVRARLAGDRDRIWVHAVSVGEVYVGLRFIEELRAARPKAAFVLTTTTSTGRRVAEAGLAEDDVLLYFPSDCPGIVRRAFRRLRPRAILLVENELWPNLLREADRRKVPVFLVNGRISASSYRGYRKVRWMTRRALPLVRRFLVQSEEDAARLLDLGAPAERVQAVGSAKYDVVRDDPAAAAQAQAILRAAGLGEGDLLLVGGSTWPGEEAALLRVYRALKPRYPALRLVLVPRHVERRPEIEADIARQGLAHTRRSALDERKAAGPVDILLVDTTGELRGLYTAATVIFVGKSLTQTGGQNIIEPALPGKPIVVGPHLENFPGVAEDFRQAGALIQVDDERGLREAVRDLLDNADKRAAYGDRARQLVERKRGAVAASVALLNGL